MPSHSYAPLKQDRFAFGIWCLQNRGRDPFGDPTRPELSALECIRGLAQRNVYGFEFHDNDLIPFGASAAQRDQVVRDLKKAMADWDVKATMATTNLFSHPVFKDGAFTSTDPAVRAFAAQKVMQALDLAAEVGAGGSSSSGAAGRASRWTPARTRCRPPSGSGRRSTSCASTCWPTTTT